MRGCGVGVRVLGLAWVMMLVTAHQASAQTSNGASAVSPAATAEDIRESSPPQTAARKAGPTALVPNPLPVPPPQQDQDIGSPTVPGSASFQSGSYRLTASGSDVWGTSDQFHFVYQPMTGDADVSLRVASLSGPSSWSKIGVMIRETLAPDAAHAFAFVSARKGFGFRQRVGPGAPSDQTGGGSGAAPGWVRLVRTGTKFDAYRSSDGQNWIPMGSATILMADAVYVGIALTAHSNLVAATAAADTFTLTQSGPDTNEPPVVSMTSPANGATFTAPASIAMSANASDADGQIARVEFYANATHVETATTAPYSATWTSAPAGTYALTAVAFDAAGASTTSAPVTVTVSAPQNQPPTAALTSPGNGATFTAPATISMAASASDPDGQVARVEFYNGATLLGSVAAAPYAFTWSSVPAGTYRLTAVAIDNAGARTTSAGATVTVNAAVASSPRAVVFQASADHAAGVTSYKLEIFAAGADPNTATAAASADLGKPTPDANGDITSDQSSLFSGLAPGTYTATVSAIGSSGATRSAQVSFTR